MTEGLQLVEMNWWAWGESPVPSAAEGNSRRLLSQPRLPHQKELVGLGRLELPTRGLGNRCSIHLSYRPTHSKRTETRNSKTEIRESSSG